MTTRRPILLAAVWIWAAGAGVTALRAASGPDKFSGNQGTIKVINYFTQGWGSPGPLTEVSPGVFFGQALVGGTPNPHAFVLTSQGALTSVYTFPSQSILLGWQVQAVNRLLYASQITPNQNFSISAGGKVTYYPLSLGFVPVFSVQLPDGTLYGTESSLRIPANRAFVSMTLAGATTVIHSFTAQEGDPYGVPILGSDGNFYGISGLGNGSMGTSAMVYRMTPAGKLTVLAEYPDGRTNYQVGAYPEMLVQVGNGTIFGTAAFGGVNQAGTVFEISAGGGYEVIHQFTNWKFGVPDKLMLASDGNVYGVAEGEPQLGGANSLFRVTPDGQFQTVYNFADGGPGLCECDLTQGSDGKIYGTSANGGASGGGEAWTWDLGLPKPLPSLKGVQPASGSAGSSVLIYGNYLLGPAGVSFNGTPTTSFRSISANYISAAVPAGATTGPVTVTTGNGSATSPGSFTVE